MIYECDKCGFKHEGILPDGYHCPLCLSGYDHLIPIEFENKVYKRVEISNGNVGIRRIEEKCINCGMCLRTCEKVTNCLVNTANNDYKDSNDLCLECGNCILTCPTSSLIPKYDYQEVLKYIDNPDYIVIALTSPATRVGIGDAFFKEPGMFLEGKMVAALKKLGFDYVFDLTFGADITSVEEAHELKERLESRGKPMFSSCCPSWVKYCHIVHPELIDNLSTCKSPIGMASTVIKKLFAPNEYDRDKKIIIVAVTPCTSKKREIVGTDTDFVITTSELALMIRENGIDFNKLEDAAFDRVKGSFSGTNYGTGGGVTKSVVRCLYYEMTGKDLKEKDYIIEDKEYYRLLKVKINSRIVRCIIVSTMSNLEKILKNDVEFDFAEIMYCDGGCVSGGGQVLMPVKDKELIKQKRAESLNKKHNEIEYYPYKNDLIDDLYNTYLNKPGSADAHKYLHINH